MYWPGGKLTINTQSLLPAGKLTAPALAIREYVIGTIVADAVELPFTAEVPQAVFAAISLPNESNI